ncbi:serine/threonine protein kinase [Microbispora sp. RL4-1S]|uniref:non-specific serine/threonine protein kinase n=1 Tax=Microbispora oryzae TaxID=2806554 RepID=A0A940WSG6_9ACTN|nr:serine/threonine-protein kinase [Microbispora oryzae]MBP2706620.1 serine/threonine protein kinase [Microbispora oryzae]
MAESLGEPLAARYHLLRPLGSGGMGTVWLARDALLDRDVAVKELRVPEGLGPRESAEPVARVMREAEVMARIRHPGIVAIHDVLSVGGKPWIVMELLHGRDLAAEVAARGPLPPPVAARVGAAVLEALTATHGRGVQHRDVKPGNVFLTVDGRAVLTDFGIARPADRTALTEAGFLVGSPGYVAPERLAGEPGGPAADLWSLAATLYTAVEGVPPYQGTQAEVIRATLTQDVRPPRLAGPLGPPLLWMLARDPGERPDAATALGLLREVAAGGAPLVRPPSSAPVRRARWPIAVAAVAVVAAAATLFVALRPSGQAPPSRAAAASPTFTRAVDLCRALSPAEAGRLLGLAAPPRVRPGRWRCQWTAKGAGIDLTAETDSDTPDPWSMSVASARTLFDGLRREYGTAPRDTDWIWYEIGVDSHKPIIKSGARAAGGVADAAFTSDVTTPDGRAQATTVCFRLGDLIVRVDFGDLDASSPAELRGRAVRAAAAAAEGLRGLA